MKIICANLQQLTRSNLEFPSKIDSLAKHFSSISAVYSRAGTNTMPFKNDIVDQLGVAAPNYNPKFISSFSEVTDQRFSSLWESQQSRPWLVYWSGGIDSTVMLASIIKNTQPEDRNNIIVACNNASIVEHPRFFKKYIEPNFQLINSTNLIMNQELLSQYYLFDGGAGDPLYCGRYHILGYENPGILEKNCYKNSDELIDLLSYTVSGDRVFARWFYEATIENINSTNVPIETFHDFFWWTYFNFAWTGIKLRGAKQLANNEPETFKLFLSNYTQWFESEHYQQWSMNNNHTNAKQGNNLGEYKLAAKQYIYELDHDEYYLYFKQKTESLSMPWVRTPDTWFCMLDDYSRLSLETNKDLIQDLLPAHFI